MELTAKKAVELSIELWEWLAETGKEKANWPEWKRNGGHYPCVTSHCFLCEYNDRHGGDMPMNCSPCPYYGEHSFCREYRNPYEKWYQAETKPTKKKYAKQFLEQLKTILKEMGD